MPTDDRMKLAPFRLRFAAAPMLLLSGLTAASGCGAMQGLGRVLEEAGRQTGAGVLRGPLPQTTPERTGYRETSTYDDVIAFVDSLQRAGLPIRAGMMGRSTAGRPIPYLIVSRPLVTSPAEARRLGRPVVYVQANIHAGEVEGKEALQMLVRDLAASSGANPLDSVVLIAVPIYNIDGNERWGPQERNRPEQNGPAMVGERGNGQNLDLNRDYVKLESPENRASLALLTEWDAEVFVDLHTTDGSFHGYALTWSPSLHPAAGFGRVYARDSLLPELRRRLRERRSIETFDYGNFNTTYGAERITDTVQAGWWTYDHRARYGTNYYGLRGRIAVLGEAYSHDPFRERVRATYEFVRQLLSLVAERRVAIRAGITAHDAALARGAERDVALRATFTRSPAVVDVLTEDIVATGDSTRTEPGMPRGYRRTGRIRTQRIPVYDRFDATLTRELPAGYLVDGSAEGDAVVPLLRAHGVLVERTRAPWSGVVETFRIDSVARAARPFQGHHETLVQGRWREERRFVPAGAWIVPTAQPFGVLAAVLLEPESDDGLAAWNALDQWLRPGADHPVMRLPTLPGVPRRID